MLFVKTFKGYEDKTAQLDAAVNEWIEAKAVDVVDIKSVLSHPHGGGAPGNLAGGDLLYTVVYRADAPIA